METAETGSAPERQEHPSLPGDPSAQTAPPATGSSAAASNEDALIREIQALPPETAWQRFVRYYLWIPPPAEAQTRAEVDAVAHRLAAARAQARTRPQVAISPPSTHAMPPDTSTSADEELASDGFIPSGTLFFLLVMLLGYALYWAYLWFIVVIERS